MSVLSYFGTWKKLSTAVPWYFLAYNQQSITEDSVFVQELVLQAGKSTQVWTIESCKYSYSTPREENTVYINLSPK